MKDCINVNVNWNIREMLQTREEFPSSKVRVEPDEDDGECYHVPEDRQGYQ